MCKKLTVAYGDYIGSRMVGWCVFNGKDYNFISDKAVKAKIKQGDLVNGLAIDADGNTVIDQSFSKILMGKSGLTFNPIMSAEDEEESVMNKYYALVKVEKGKDGNRYHFITNRCGYEVFAEEQLKAMLAVLEMGGVRMDENGNLVIHKAVDVEEANEGQNKRQTSPKGGKEVG